MTDSLRHQDEDKLINVSKQYHKAIAETDSKGLSSLFAAKVVLYADKVCLNPCHAKPAVFATTRNLFFVCGDSTL